MLGILTHSLYHVLVTHNSLYQPPAMLADTLFERPNAATGWVARTTPYSAAWLSPEAQKAWWESGSPSVKRNPVKEPLPGWPVSKVRQEWVEGNDALSLAHLIDETLWTEGRRASGLHAVTRRIVMYANQGDGALPVLALRAASLSPDGQTTPVPRAQQLLVYNSQEDSWTGPKPEEGTDGFEEALDALNVFFAPQSTPRIPI